MKKKWTKFLSAMALSIIGAIIFMFSLCATCKADTFMYQQFVGSVWTIKENNVVVATDTLTLEDLENENEISLDLARNCYEYVYELESTRYIDIEIELAQYIDAPVFVQFMGSTSLVQSIGLYNDTYSIAYFEVDTQTYYTLNENKDFYNDIYITFWSDDFNWSLVFGYDYLSYVKGLNDMQMKYDFLQQQYDDLIVSNQQLQSNYAELESLYNGLASGQYTFESLFWSVGSVPMAVLLQTFNVNVLGMNIRAIITGLLTALVVIWLIKRLFK